MTTIANTHNSVPIEKSNADGILTEGVEREYLTIDFLNFVRNLLVVVGTSLTFLDKSIDTAGTATGTTIAATAAGPFCSLVAGGLYLKTGIPGLQSARKSASLAKKHLLLEQASQLSSKIESSEGSVRETFERAKQLFIQATGEQDSKKRSKLLNLASKLFKAADSINGEPTESDRSSLSHQVTKTNKYIQDADSSALVSNDDTERLLPPPETLDLSKLFSEITPSKTKTIDSLLDATKKTSLKTKKLAQVTIRYNMEKYGARNWGLYLSIGVAQIVSGITAMLGPTMANLLGYTALLTKEVAQVVLMGVLAGTGILYIARGLIMLYRAQTNLDLTKALRDEIKTTFSTLSDNPPDDAKKILLFLETNCALKEVEIKDKNGNVTGSQLVDIYTGMTLDEIQNLSSKEQITQYLQKLDEGLYGEILKQEIAWNIGAVMILGGVLTLIAAGCSSGIAVPIISLISAVIFMSMEGTFLLYDSSDHMTAYTHKNYKQPDWLNTHKPEKIFELPEKVFKEEYQTNISPQVFTPVYEKDTSAVSLTPVDPKKSTACQIIAAPLTATYRSMKVHMYPLTIHEEYKARESDKTSWERHKEFLSGLSHREGS